MHERSGHGDARGGDSWGYADRIDALYLRNPAPLIDFVTPMLASNTTPLHWPSLPTSVEVVPSILDLTSSLAPAKPARPPPPVKATAKDDDARSTHTQYSVDPFAPFDDAASVAASNYAQPPPSSASAILQSMPLYDAPPMEQCAFCVAAFSEQRILDAFTMTVQILERHQIMRRLLLATVT